MSGKNAFTIIPDIPSATYNVSAGGGDEDDANACPSASTVTSGAGPDNLLSLREAICEVNNLATASSVTINVPAGTYTLSLNAYGGNGSSDTNTELQLGGLTSGTSISIVGAGSSSTIIEQQASTIDRIFEQDYSLVGNIPVMLSGLTVQNGKCTNQNTSDCGYGGGGMLGTGDTGDNLTLNNVTFNKNTVNATANGGGLASSIFGGLTITSCAFSSNTATGGVGGALDFNVGAGGSGNLGITTSSFTGNASTAGSEPGGRWRGACGLSSGNSATISKSTFTGNQAQGSGSIGGAILANLGTTVSNSRIVGNTADTGSGFAETGGTGNTGVVIDNWWGCNAGPGGTGCDTTGTSGAGSAATFNPWPALSISANPTQVAP